MYDDGLAIAVIDTADAQRPTVTAVRWCPLAAEAKVGSVLADAIRAMGARGLPVYATLPNTTYSLVQLEAPELADDELSEAMRWRVKDLIDFPVEEAAIDVFHLPESHRPGAPALLYVVVAQSTAVDALAAALKEAGLTIEAIDIAEMAIRNLAMHVDRPGRPRAYLHLQPGQTLIEIADGEQIYLSRRVMQDFDAGSAAELLHAQMENLALEVQRSLDYYESQYALGPADRLSVLVCEPALFEAFAAVARDFLTVKTERFDLAELDVAEGVELTVLGRGVTALGAALLAGLGVGFWSDRAELEAPGERAMVFEPKLGAERREALYAGWKRAVERSRDWEEV